EQSEITEGMNIWTMDKSANEKALSNNPIVASVDINRHLPWSVSIEVEEYHRVGYIQKDTSYYAILGNGRMLQSMETGTFYGDAPLITNFEEESYLHRMTSELEKLP
ncbi:cell division protein FtsQ/DivIB, partial [Virgibacillus salexigens]|uniref:cell division protein FtsQ/DivIB n=1 Tax=Virgibacillus massiliensis TaxID=1462526 RepID=UPI0018E1226A